MRDRAITGALEQAHVKTEQQVGRLAAQFFCIRLYWFSSSCKMPLKFGEPQPVV